MPDVTFKALCMDVTADHARSRQFATFWSQALDQPLVEIAAGEFRLDPAPGSPPARQVWIDEVPEAPAGKPRVHLDIRSAAGIDRFVEAGATVVRAPDAEIHWHVLEAPDRFACCVMGRHPEYPDAPDGPFELVVDARDPHAIARWWADRMGGEVADTGGNSFISGAEGFPFMFWVFNPSTEPKAVKNRMHWDVTLGDADIDGLVRAGATVLREPTDDDEWWVLTDPEGNEFCAFPPPDLEWRR